MAPTGVAVDDAGRVGVAPRQRYAELVHRHTALAVVGAIAAAASVIAAAPAEAAQGGNNGRAPVCHHSG